MRAQIKHQSSLAVMFSQQALEAARSQNFAEAQALMRQAAKAGRICRAMLEQLNAEKNSDLSD